MNNEKINVYLTFVFFCIFIPPRRRRRRRRNEEERKSAAEAHRLIAISESAHSAHNAEDIIVARENLDGVVGVDTLEVEGGVVDAAHVAATGRLVLLGAKREGVHVDSGLGNALVVLVRLDKLEVGGLAGGGPVVAVELEVSLVEGGGVLTDSGAVSLLNPYELLDGVVEVELDLALRLLFTSELKLLNEVLVGDLGEAATLIGVEVDVVDVESGGVERLGSAGNARGGAGELDNKLDLVVLEGNKGKGETRVAAEPELEGDVQGACGTVAVGSSVGGDTVNHLRVTVPVTGGLGKLVPDGQPLTVVLVNALATDLALDGGNELVAEVIGVSVTSFEGREVNLHVNAVDEVTVPGNGAGNFLAVISATVELLIDGLHREVGVTTVDNLPEGDLGVAREVDVLGAVGDELHETASHCCCFIYSEKKNQTKKKTQSLYFGKTSKTFP